MARAFTAALALVWLISAVASAANETAPLPTQKTDVGKPLGTTKPVAAKPEPKAPNWQQLTAQQKQLLAELAPQWDQQTDRLRNGLIKVANKYPKMKPDEQERVRGRITRWANFTPEQRDAARAHFQNIKKQPPEKQKEVKRKWEKYKAQQQMPVSAVTPTSALETKNPTTTTPSVPAKP